MSNAELIKYGADLAEQGPLPADWAVEILRRLNYYTDGLERHTASNIDDRQLTLPL